MLIAVKWLLIAERAGEGTKAEEKKGRQKRMRAGGGIEVEKEGRGGEDSAMQRTLSRNSRIMKSQIR